MPAMLVSLPLWFVPFLAVVLSPLICGWLTYKVMSYDVLADCATADTRRALIGSRRPELLCVGVMPAYVSGVPGLISVYRAFTVC